MSKRIDHAKAVLSSRTATKRQKDTAARFLLGQYWSPDVIRKVALQGASPVRTSNFYRIRWLKKIIADPKSTSDQRQLAADELVQLGV